MWEEICLKHLKIKNSQLFVKARVVPEPLHQVKQAGEKSSTATHTPRGAPPQARPSTTLPEELLPATASASADLAGTFEEEERWGGRK